MLGILVFVHEFGHFIIARMLGVKVSAFSIGFGKELWHHIDKYGMRGGEMGCCVKYCLPKHLRSDGGEHTSAPMRRKHSVANTELPVHRKLYDDVVDFVYVYYAGFGEADRYPGRRH